MYKPIISLTSASKNMAASRHKTLSTCPGWILANLHLTAMQRQCCTWERKRGDSKVSKNEQCINGVMTKRLSFNQSKSIHKQLKTRRHGKFFFLPSLHITCWHPAVLLAGKNRIADDINGTESGGQRYDSQENWEYITCLLNMSYVESSVASLVETLSHDYWTMQWCSDVSIFNR